MRKRFAFVLMVGIVGWALAAPPSVQADETGNMVFFRGGWAGMTSDRAGEVFTDAYGNTTRNDGSSGYYVGGGLDLVLSKDVWGLLSKTWALGEIGVEYKHLGSNTVTCPLCATPKQQTVQVTMLTVDIAPKIKFMEGSSLRPWIIPVGLDFHVISPPSNAVTVLDVGVQFGAGADYRIYKAFHIGIDGRFHLASGATTTTNNFGTLGAYVGIAF